MVLNTPDAPWNRPDDTRKHESCVVCNRNMVAGDTSWQADWLDEDERSLHDAGDVPGGVVCSHACRSTALFNGVGPDQQKALRFIEKNLDGLYMSLQLLGFRKPFDTKAKTVLDAFVDKEPFGQLYDAIFQIERILRGGQNDNPPKWVEEQANG